MIEVEIKLPVCSRQSTEQKLVGLGFEEGHLVKESDIYFTSDARDFKKTDEALRIRRCENLTTGESAAVLTYKGAKIDKISMTRKELETGIEDADVCREILSSIGFRPFFPVNKCRQYYHYDHITACLDVVDNLGDFLELEVLVEEEKEREEALQQIEEILEKMGRSMAETIRTSYLSMLQQKNHEYQTKK